MTKAVILAAGRGSRLKGFTEDRPKCLNRVGGRTLLEWQVSALTSAGVRDVMVVTGYRAEMLESYPVTRINNPVWERTNMVRSLLCVRNEFVHPLVVSYGDILYSRDTVRQLLGQISDLAVTYDTEWRWLWDQRFDDPLSDAESFKIGQDGTILDIGRRVRDAAEIQGQYMGLLKFSPQALAWMVESTDAMSPGELDRLDMTTLLRRLISGGHPVHGMPIHGGWCEIDTETDLKLAERLVREGRLSVE